MKWEFILVYEEKSTIFPKFTVEISQTFILNIRWTIVLCAPLKLNIFFYTYTVDY